MQGHWLGADLVIDTCGGAITNGDCDEVLTGVFLILEESGEEHSEGFEKNDPVSACPFVHQGN